ISSCIFFSRSAKATEFLPGLPLGRRTFSSLGSVFICSIFALPTAKHPAFIFSLRGVWLHDERAPNGMGDQASSGCLCCNPSALCRRRIFLHPAFSRYRWLSTRGLKRRGVAEPE